MIRKSTALILCLFLLVGLYGCAGQSHGDPLKSPMKFYYKTSDASYGDGQGATDYELRETYGHESDYVWVLTEYLKGPISQKLTAPFQRSVSIVSAERSGSQLQLRMTQELANLSGADLTVACACITLTCLEFPGVEAVSIRAVGSKLDGKTEILFKPEQSFYWRTAAPAWSTRPICCTSPTQTTGISSGEKISVGEGQENLPDYLVHRLLEGPTEPSLAETMPLGTTLLGLEVTEGICAINLSREFLDHAPQTALAQRMTILSPDQHHDPAG